jgi:hypothetical protein
MMNSIRHLKNMKKISEYFCVAPWTHTYLSPQSERRLCCASRETASFQKQYIDSGETRNEYDPITLEEHWNSDHMKSVRKRILAGENIPECQVCDSNLLNLYTYRQYFTETLFPHKVQDILDNTDETGHTTLKPISFDYRIYNLCNFKCRMCGEQLSSSWETEKRVLNMWSPTHDRWMLPENKQKIENFQSDVAEKELWDAVLDRSIEEIYWVGGEPLMYDIHWKVMNYLVLSGHSKNVVVRYNTNLSRESYQNNNLFDLLKHFKRVNMCCSMDATGKVAEYIRHGLDYDKWLELFKKGIPLNDKYGMDAMVIDVTLTLPGMLDMKNLIDLAVELNVKSYVKITFDFDPSAIMSPMCLPREILNPILTDLIEYEQKHGNDLTRVYGETFKDMLTRPNFNDKYTDYKEGLVRGKKRYQKIDEHRGDIDTLREILSRNKQVLDWYDNI